MKKNLFIFILIFNLFSFSAIAEEFVNFDVRDRKDLIAPKTELDFIKTIKRTQNEYVNAKNEVLAKAAIEKRDRTFETFHKNYPKMNGWIGVIVDLSSEDNNDIYLKVKIARSIYLTTKRPGWFPKHAYIKNGTKAYKSFINQQLDIGDIIYFSGNFIYVTDPDKPDIYEAYSFSKTSGGIVEYSFKFSSFKLIYSK